MGCGLPSGSMMTIVSPSCTLTSSSPCAWYGYSILPLDSLGFGAGSGGGLMYAAGGGARTLLTGAGLLSTGGAGDVGVSAPLAG